MELSAKYQPSEVEDKCYKKWIKEAYFHSEPDSREAYTIVIPPPNVTGILHMGHVLNNTLNDVLIRRARMKGKNACWVPGTDHASIATENKVIERLEKQGIKKEDLSREEFLAHAWKWKEEHGGIILKQLRKLGASCDWDRTRFTMEDELSEAVINCFVHFYKKGLIYRGVRMVNWDPERLTALSDEEVIHKDTKSHFYHLRYFIADENNNASDEYLIIATTRPETIMADAAISVHPEDERYHHLRGKKVLIPLINKAIPIIEDSYVERDFGTGCLKVTPAHDVNDYEIGLRHNLPIIDIIDDHGKLNEAAQILVGEDRFVARKKIAKLLEEAGNLEKIEEYTSPIGYSERSNAVIEPKLSTQWFLKMEGLAQKALASVEESKVRLIPDKYRNTYRHWMENVRDWCISRQLWWGQRIPAYYLPDGSYVVENSLEKAYQEALKLNPKLKIEELRQDEDVLDTWFSSWLWPISVFDPKYIGQSDAQMNKDLSYYYPTSDLVTGPDILFFWVARMIMAGNEFLGKEPFKNVYLTGIVRDKQGRKMSKTLGNSPDPLELIEKYGADAVRIGMLLCSSAGNDIFYDESQIEQGRNFCNKIWNAFRLIKGWSVDSQKPISELSKISIDWFNNRLNQVVEEVEDDYSKFRISDALMKIYKLFWDDFCSWYLEMIKPSFGESIDESSYNSTINFFDKLLRLIHPVMPFISEELWQAIEERGERETIIFAQSPNPEPYNKVIVEEMSLAQELIIELRALRQKKNISPKISLNLDIKKGFPEAVLTVVKKLANIQDISISENLDMSKQGISFLVRTYQFFVELEGQFDVEAELKKLQAELDYQKKFLASVQKKLANEKFVNNAPEAVVAVEKQKEDDSMAKIKGIEAQIKSIS